MRPAWLVFGIAFAIADCRSQPVCEAEGGACVGDKECSQIASCPNGAVMYVACSCVRGELRCAAPGAPCQSPFDASPWPLDVAPPPIVDAPPPVNVSLPPPPSFDSSILSASEQK